MVNGSGKDKVNNNHGGRRKGSGRPKKEPTKTLSYRVPVAKADQIDTACKQIIQSISKNNKA